MNVSAQLLCIVYQFTCVPIGTSHITLNMFLIVFKDAFAGAPKESSWSLETAKGILHSTNQI